MWWKLGCLAAISLIAIVSVIPIRTHAVGYNVYTEAPPPPPTLLDTISAGYFTPGTFAEIGIILLVAILLAVRVVRDQAEK